MTWKLHCAKSQSVIMALLSATLGLVSEGCAGGGANVRADVRMFPGAVRQTRLSPGTPVTIVVVNNATGKLVIPGPLGESADKPDHYCVAFIHVDWEDRGTGELASLPVAVAEEARGVARNLGCDELQAFSPLKIIPSDTPLVARRCVITFVASTTKAKRQDFDFLKVKS